MEHIIKNIDQGYQSFYMDILNTKSNESLAPYYTTGRKNMTTYINDFANTYTYKVNNISFDSVKSIHKRNQNNSGFLEKRSYMNTKFYENTSIRKESLTSPEKDYVRGYNCNICKSWHSYSTTNKENDVNAIQTEIVYTDNISRSMPTQVYCANIKFLFTGEFLDFVGITRDVGSRDFRLKEYYRRSKMLYKFLEENVGDEELVETRRILLENKFRCFNVSLDNFFASGSKAEGLDLKYSDTDIMIVKGVACEIDGKLKLKKGFLFDSTSDATTPGYVSIRQVTEWIISDNEFCSSQFKCEFQSLLRLRSSVITYEHGPSISYSEFGTENDYVLCLKTEKWPRIAVEFGNRTRYFEWPSNELVFHIIQSGCHIVPKSPTKNQICHEWRLSFSQAETALVKSFNHTQLMTYCALKVLLKEILKARRCDFESVFSSYIMKTSVFWVSESNEKTIWQPSNIILCITLCIEFITSCVKTQNIPNFFVQTSNMYLDKYPTEAIPELLQILNAARSNIMRLIWQAESFSTLNKRDKEISGKDWEIAKNSDAYRLEFLCFHKSLIYIGLKCVEHCAVNLLTATNLCDMPIHKYLKELFLYPCYQLIKYSNAKTNKHEYNLNKLNLQFILCGNRIDKITAKLNLASWFYNHKRYDDSLNVLGVALKWIGNAVYYSEMPTVFHNQSVISKVILKSYNFKQTALKFHMDSYKIIRNSNCTIHEVKELENHIRSQNNVDANSFAVWSLHAETYTHFLCFLCNHKLDKINERSENLKDLQNVQFLRSSIIYHHHKYFHLLIEKICKQLIEEHTEQIDFNKIFASLKSHGILDLLALYGTNRGLLF